MVLEKLKALFGEEEEKPDYTRDLIAEFNPTTYANDHIENSPRQYSDPSNTEQGYTSRALERIQHYRAVINRQEIADLDVGDEGSIGRDFVRMVPFGRAFTTWGREELADKTNDVAGIPKELLKEYVNFGLLFMGPALFRMGAKSIPIIRNTAMAERYITALGPTSGIRQVTKKTVTESMTFMGLGLLSGAIVEGDAVEAAKQGGTWATFPLMGRIAEPVLKQVGKLGTGVVKFGSANLRKIPYVEEWLVPDMQKIREWSPKGFRNIIDFYQTHSVKRKELHEFFRSIMEEFPKDHRNGVFRAIVNEKIDAKTMWELKNIDHIPDDALPKVLKHAAAIQQQFFAAGNAAVEKNLMSAHLFNARMNRYFPAVRDAKSFMEFRQRLYSYGSKTKQKQIARDMSRFQKSIMQDMTADARIAAGQDMDLLATSFVELDRIWKDVHITTLFNKLSTNGDLTLSNAMRNVVLENKGFVNMTGDYKVPGNYGRLFALTEKGAAMIKNIGDPKMRRNWVERWIRNAQPGVNKPSEVVVKNVKLDNELLAMDPHYDRFVDKILTRKTGKRTFARMPNDKDSFGDLAGQVVTPGLRDELVGMQGKKSSEAMKFYHDVFLNPWRASMTTWNLKFHIRNPISNISLNHMNGMPFWEMDYYARGMKHLVKGQASKYFKLAESEGLFRSSLATHELQQLKQSLSFATDSKSVFQKYAAFRGAGKLNAKLGRAVQFEEEWAKMSMFIYNIEKRGMTVGDAARSALESTFDYSEIPKAIKFIKPYIPFAIFPYKSLTTMSKAMVASPWRAATLLYPILGMHHANVSQLDISDDEYKRMMNELPEYYKNGRFFLMPEKDMDGRLQLMDYGYMLPWGDLFRTGTMAPDPASFLRQNPLISIGEDITRNRDWLDRPLTYEWEDGKTKTWKRLRHVFDAVSPSLVGRDLTELTDRVLTDDPNARTKAQWVLKHTGFKISPIDPSQVTRNYYNEQRRQMGQVKGQYRRALRKGEDPVKSGRRRLEALQRILNK